MTKSEDIIFQLRAMRLPRFAEEYERYTQDPAYTNISHDDLLYELVSAEYDSRTNNTIDKLIKSATFYDSSADLKDVNYKPERHLDPLVIERLSTNDYIENHLSIILIGASGCGKTWLACALGTNACRSKYKVKYIRLPELYMEFEARRLQNQYRQYIRQLQKYDLLIIDEFLLVSSKPEERNDLLELMEARTNRKSTIFCSQWTPDGWYERLGSGPVTEAILDRIVNSSYRIELHGNSLREDYSKLDK